MDMLNRCLAFIALSFLTVPAIAALGVSMSVETGYDNPIYPGDVTALHITLTNSNTASTVTGATFTNTMPVELVVAGSGLVSYTCTDGTGGAAATAGSVTATTGSNVIQLVGGTLPAAGAQIAQCDIVVEITSTTPGGHDNIIGIGDVSGTDTGPVSNTTASQQTINVLSLNAPDIDKQFGQSTIVQNDEPVTLSITIDNGANANRDLPLNGVGDTPAYGLEDVLPAGLEVASSPNAGVSCVGGGTPPTFSPSAGDTTLNVVGGTIAAGGRCTMTVDIIGTDTGAGYSQVLTNTINGTTQFFNARGLSASGNTSASLTVASALQVDTNFNPSNVRQGQQSTLTATFRNASPTTTLTGVAFTQNNIKVSGSGAGTLTVNNVSANAACGGATVNAINGNLGFSIANGSIAPGASCVVTITYTGTLAAAGTPETFTHSIAQNAVANDQGANSQAASDSVTIYDELTISKSRSPSNPAPGNPVRYTIRVNNYSGGALSGVQITDTLPAGMFGLTSPAPSMSGTGCAGVLTDNIAGPPPSTNSVVLTFDMNAGSGANASRCDVSFWAMTPTGSAAGSSHVNTIGAGGVCDNNGAGPVCNSNGNSASVTLTDVITIDNDFDPNSASEGTVAQLTLTLSNLSASAVSNAAITNLLPTGSTGLPLTIANPAVASTTCAGGVVTATPGDSSVSLSGAAIPARASNGTGTPGSCTVTLNVIGAAGVYVDDIPAGALTATETLQDGSTRTASSPGPIQTTLTYTSALTASKVFSPSTIESGGVATVAIRLGNVGAGTLNGVAVDDPLPTGMTVANPANGYTTCGGSPSVTAVAGASSASMSGAVIPASGQCEFLFDVTASGGADWTNSIPAGNITATGGVQNINIVSAVLNNSSAGAITISNSINPNSLAAPGETGLLTITLVNNGSIDLTGVGLTDYFTSGGTSGGTPTGMIIAATPNASTTCNGGVVNASADGTQVDLSGASIDAGDSCTVTVNVSTTQVGTILDEIPVGAVTTDQGISNTLDASTSLQTQANIGVTKQFLPAVVEPGERSRVRITFINPLSQPLANIAVSDILPAGVTIPAGANPTTTCTGGSVTSTGGNTIVFSGGTLPAASGGAASSCVAEIDVVASSAGSYTNQIPANAVTASVGGAGTSNQSPASADLEVRTPLTVSKAFAPSSVPPGTVSTLTITIDNPNSIATTATALTDDLPAGLTVALTPNASTSCAGGVVTAPASATAVSLASANVPAGGSCVVTVDTVSNTAGVYSNVIPASAVSTAEGISNEDPATDDLTVSQPPTVGKQFSPPLIPAGGTSTLTIVIDNDNSTAMTTTANFVDNLPTAPGNVLVAGVPNASTTCTGSVVASAGSGQVRLNNGATIPAGGCTISVDVTASTVGEHINVIPSAALQTNLGNNLQATNASLEVSALGYVSGRVFADNNLVPNGSFESGTDTPLQGITINLRDAGNTVVATTTTDTLGNYLFSGLAAGTYSVEQPSQPTGTVNGITTAGSIVGSAGGTPGTATGIATTPSRINTIVLGNAAQIDGSPDNNFAEVVPSTISGRVFLDVNNNGTQNGADTALAGETIELLDNGGGVITTTTTDANGDYRFDNLDPATYSVRQPNQPANSSNGITTAGSVANGGTAGSATAPTTTPSQISMIVLPPNTTASGNNFAEIPNDRRISGTVFLDFDNNGAINGSDHGIDAVTIDLSGTDNSGNPVSATTTTAADGTFSFTGLAEGTYTLDQAAQPTGSTNGTTTAGSTGGVASNPTATSSRIAGIDLTGSNTVSGDNLFAEQPDASPDLTISITHSPASFGEGSTTGYYTVTPGNIAAVPTSGVMTIITTLPAGITPASWPTTGDWICNAVGQVVTCTGSTVIGASSTGTPIILPVNVAGGIAPTVLTADTVISGGGETAGFEGNNTDSDPTPITQSASVAGTVWFDSNHDRVRDGGERVIANWTVELVYGGVVVATATTDASGAYLITGVAPGSGYEIRFREPVSGAIWGRPVPNESGAAFTDGVTSAANPAGADTSAGVMQGLSLVAGSNTVEQSLPLDPSGVVYDSITRQPVIGAVVSINGPGGFNAAAHLVGGAANASQTTGADGFYQFLLLPGAPAGTYTLTVAEPGGYLPGGSSIIPVCTNTLTVGAAPDPALVHNVGTAPAAGSPIHDPLACPAGSAALAATANSTQYYLSFDLTPGVSADLVNNHIPLDVVTADAFIVTKTTPLVNVSRGDLVPYTITVTNNLTGAIPNVDVRDQIPPGFKFRSGSASVDGVSQQPTVNGRLLTWPNLSFAVGQQRVFKLMLVVGAGVGEGEYINQAWAENSLIAARISNLATASVRVTPDPTFDCSDLIGKVFDDRNVNGYQDEGEPGIPNVRVVTVRGLLITSDEHGRFHIACADVPNEWRGGNFILKLDERTLPSGYRLTTENPRVVRLTRGKLSKLNFGAAIHRVVRLDVAPEAFVAGSDELVPVWQDGIAKLVETLRQGPSVLRIAYTGNPGDPPERARSRVEHLQQLIEARWDEHGCCYPLHIETEMSAGGAGK